MMSNPIDSRKQQILLRSRMNRGRTEAPSFLSAVAEAVGEPVDMKSLVPLPETDILREAFRAGYQNVVREATVGYRKLFLPSQSSLVFRLATCLADQVSTERSFFLTKLSEYCGAVSLNLSVLLKHAASIIKLDGDSLSALSTDQTEGILIDHNPDDPEQAYEVAVWGDRWPLMVLACDHRLTSGAGPPLH
jgi:hypothetical protein